MKKLSILLTVLIIATPLASYKILDSYFHSPGKLDKETAVTIPKGATLTKIAKILADNNIIKHPSAFQIYIQFFREHRSLKAGEYSFPPKVSPAEVYNIISSGKTVSYQITFPEGITVYQIGEILMAEDKLIGTIPHTLKEGYFMPESYSFKRGDTKQSVLNRMNKAMTEFLDNKWETRDKNLPIKNKEEALILASIVEKETSVPEERGRIAAVFINRLRKGMRLQSDPTTIYGITKGTSSLGRKLLTKDLRKDNPYNTYKINGLPPTPIANPSKEAIKAVLNPPKTNEFYFVADGTGGHVFSSTLEEHNRNVRKWREFRRENNF